MSSEFTDNQRNVFCVFSGNGVNGLREHLNGQEFIRNNIHDDDDDDQTMTGMMGAAALTAGDDDDVDGNGDDFGLEDDQDQAPGGVSFGGAT